MNVFEFGMIKLSQEELNCRRAIQDHACSARGFWEDQMVLFLNEVTYSSTKVPNKAIERMVRFSRCYATSQIILEATRAGVPRGAVAAPGRLRLLWSNHECRVCSPQPFVLEPEEIVENIRVTAQIDKTQVCVGTKDHTGVITWVDHAFRHLVTPSEEILGHTTREIWSDKHGEEIYEHDMEVLSGSMMVARESLLVRGVLRQRLSVRFPLDPQNPNTVTVVGFDAPKWLLTYSDNYGVLNG